MAQQSLLKICLSSIGVNDPTVIIHGHRVNREIASLKVLLERHRRMGVNLKAMIPATRLSLGTR